MSIKAVGMVAVTAFLLAGVDRRANADTTTTCTIDSWGDLICTQSSAAPTAPPTAAGGAAGLTLIAGLVASLYGNRSDTTNPAHDKEVALGIMVGVEMFANPLMLYFDSAAPEQEVKEQWQRKNKVIAEAWGTAVRDASPETVAAFGGRITLGRGRIGVDAGGESATDPKRHSVVAAHFLLRTPPRRRAVIGLAIGASRVAFGGQVRTGIDVSVPHSYVLSHDDKTGAADVSISSRPGFFYGENGIDARLDIALVVPVASRLAVEIGGGVFSFDELIRFKGSAGLALAF